MKKPTLSIDLPICADLRDFFREFSLEKIEPNPGHGSWLNWCLKRKEKYPTVLPTYWKGKDAVNPYCFASALFAQLGENQVIVTGDGTACVVTFQAAHLKKGQRLYTNSGCASMGYDLPAAIGAAIANPGEKVVCITGDGSLQLNIQELQTIIGKRLPIKIFCLNNNGYHSIQQTQENFFPGNVVGCGPESGVTLPEFRKIAEAYGFPYSVCRTHKDLTPVIRESLAGDTPYFCEIILDRTQGFAPKVTSKRLPDGRLVTAPLEDMAPFLSREEFLDNLLIQPVEY